MRAIDWMRASALAVTMCVSSPVAMSTDGISCTGTVHRIGVHGTNRVILQLSGMNARVRICDLEQTLGTTYPITAAQCKAAYATLLMARAMGETVQIYFDNVQTGTSCSTFVDFEIATARWVYLQE